METLSQQVQQIIQDCQLQSEDSQSAQAKKALYALLADYTINPTGDDPLPPTPADESIIEQFEKLDLFNELSQVLRHEITAFIKTMTLLERTAALLSPEAEKAMKNEIRQLADSEFLHPQLIDKFKIHSNREFLEKALHNTSSLWQIAMVAKWVLSSEGIEQLSRSSWHQHCPDKALPELIDVLIDKITFQHIQSLRAYRKDAMHHYPRISPEEFGTLKSDQWQEIIDFPSGRKPQQDIPFITPFIKQGDIEHSLYRHFLMPDLLLYMRDATPACSNKFDLQNQDKNILLSLPIVLQQVEEELFNQLKNTIAGQITAWAQAHREYREGKNNEVSAALAITDKIWNYKRTPAAQECTNPVENLTKGFTATIRNAFNHFSDINIAASGGSSLDAVDVAEKFVLFASVSNGQLDTLASAHSDYINNLPNPADWDNEVFFQHFLDANLASDIQHIQGHFVVDKTRGCPAVPQIARFHEIVLDLVLDFTLREFGEENLRKAGDWYLQEKVP
jgi:hypothetical protein